MNEEDVRLTRAWVLHPDMRGDAFRKSPDSALAEAVALAAALPELEVIGSDIVRLPKPNAGLLFGKGKVAEIKAKIQAANG